MGRADGAIVVLAGMLSLAWASPDSVLAQQELPGEARPLPVPVAVGALAWIEVFEVFELPCDPWAVTPQLVDPTSARQFRQTRERYLDELGKATARGDGVKQVEQRGERLRREIEEKLRKRLSSQPPVTVVRAWNGLEQSEVVFSLGAGQKDIASVLQPGTVRRVEFGLARIGDDLQAARPTVPEVQAGKVPTNFAPWKEIKDRRPDTSFGLASTAALPRPTVLRAKLLHPEGDEFMVEVPAPPRELRIEADAFPWYCNFEVYELDKGGARLRQASVAGKRSAVSLPIVSTEWTAVRPGAPIAGRNSAFCFFRITDPQPWGYEIEITEWHGVVPRAAAKQPAPKRPTTDAPGGSPPVAPPPSQPPEPVTPAIPPSRARHVPPSAPH